MITFFLNQFNSFYQSIVNTFKSTINLFFTEISVFRWAVTRSYESKNLTTFKSNKFDLLNSFKHISPQDWRLQGLSNPTKTLNKKFHSYELLYSPLKLSTLYNNILIKDLYLSWADFSSRTFSFGFYHLRALVFILFIDACLTDDEPLWEPVEWSLVQTWILFIFTFAWIAENLIVSRYGSYTGRDKRVWFSWYKTFYLIEIYYAINYGVATLFVIVPFYFETNYNLSFIFSWWHWFSRVFFFKLISIFTIMLMLSYVFQLSIRWLDWKKGLFMVTIINIFLSYLIYTHFIMLFFGYFTDPVWYQKTRPVDYIQLSHEPSRWGWGPAKKDHFTYHNVKTVFWFKNDGPFASSFLLFHQFFFLSLFALYIYWISLFRRIYSTKEIPLTYSTYCVSALKQFFYCFFMLYAFVLASYIFNYQRFPIEFLWTIDDHSWLTNMVGIFCEYPSFLYSVIFS